MTIEAELPDGTILEFPDGTDTAVITNTVKRQLRSAPRAPAPVAAQPRVSAPALPAYQPTGLLDRAGALWERGVAGLDAGAAQLRGALQEWNANNPLPWTSDQNVAAARSDAAAARRESAQRNAVTNRQIAGEQTWEDLKQAPTLGKVAQFIGEQSITSLPGMASAMLTAPLYLGTQAGNIGQQRAMNNGGTDASLSDVGQALPYALASTALERVGGMGILETPGKNALTRITKAGLKEAATEYGQGQIEYAGGTLGTTQGYDFATGNDQGMAGAIAGLGMGAGGHAVIETPHMVGGTIQAGARVLERRRAAREQAQAQQEMAVGAQLVDALTQNAQPATEPLPVAAGPARSPAVNTPLGGGDAPAAQPIEPVAQAIDVPAQGPGQALPSTGPGPSRGDNGDLPANVGSDAGNGFFYNGDGGRSKVSTDAGVRGSVLLGKVGAGGTVSGFYVGQDGRLIDSDEVNFVDQSTVGRVWTDGSDGDRAQVADLLRQAQMLPVGDPARKPIMEQIRQIVTGEASSPVASSGQPAATPEPARQAPEPAAPLSVMSVKRRKNNDGIGVSHHVTLSDGSTVQIFRDTDQFGTPVWHLDTGSLPGSKAGDGTADQTMLGFTRDDALAALPGKVDRLRATIAARAEKVAPAKANPAVEWDRKVEQEIQGEIDGLRAVIKGLGPDDLVRGPSGDGPKRSVSYWQSEIARKEQELAQLRGEKATPQKNRRKKARAPDASQDDVLTFLALQGGVDEGSHDLVKGRKLQRFIPGVGTWLRKGGVGVDQAGELLWEHGYFGPPATTPRPSEDEVLQFLEAAHASPRYRHDVQEQRDLEAARRASDDEEGYYRSLIQDSAKANGHDLTPEEEDVALSYVAGGMDVDQATEKAVADAARADLVPLSDEAGDNNYAPDEYTPPWSPDDFPDDYAGEPAGEVPASDERPAPERGEPGDGGAARAQSGDLNAGSLGLTAEQRAQEGLTERQRAEIAAQQQQGMSRRGDQAGLGDQEGGLFSNERNQTSMFDNVDNVRPKRRNNASMADMLDVEDRSGIQADNKGGYADSFVEASYTDRASVYEGAIRAIGMEPDKFRALAPDRQARLLADALKKLTGINVEIEPDLQLRLAIDQLLDAHQSIQAMAYTLGVSPRAIGLGGKLGLRLLRKSGRIRYLGVFRSDQNEIVLPGRSNSFAHEWAHALDWHLLGKVSDEMARGLTGKVREEGADFQPQNVREAFVNLLNAMFFDNVAMAQKIMRLEEQIAATKSAKRKAELQAQIDNYKAGRSQAKERSQYWKGADATNKAGGNGDYWTQPTEMFARAFEAYVSWRVGQEGHGTEFIGKGDTNYRSNPEDRFAKTFPKDEERERIFQAINDLMFQLHKESLIDGDGTPGSLPSRDDITRLTDLDHYMREVENGSLIQRETEAIKREMRQRARAAAGRAPDPKNFAQRAQDVVANYFYSMAAKLRMIEKRYNSAAVKRIHDLLAWTPGKGEGIGATFHEAVDMRTKIQLNRVSNAMRQAGIKEMTAEVDAELRKAMTGDGYKGSPEIMDLAARLRKILDEEFYQNQRAGIDIGYIRDQGYLPRMLDLPRVLNDEAKFTKQAADTYEHVWNRDYGEDAQTLLAEPKATNLFMRILKAIDPDAHKDIKKLRKQISRLESQVSTSDDPDALLAKLEKLHAQLTELVDDALPGVRRSWATEAADKWLANLKFGADYDFDSHAPDSTYTKKRVLPKEADELLADFYIQSQMETISRYLTQSVRRTEYAKRFGAKGEKLEEMLREASAQGVSSEDVTEIRRVVAVAAGRQKSDTPRSVQRFMHGFHNIYTMALLGRAVISSAVEPLTAGITAGDFLAGIKALSATLAGQKSMNGKQRAELARAMGIVLDHGADTILTERFGGEWGETIKYDKWLSEMFIRTGLHALTRAQRTHTLAVAHAYLDNLSMRVLDFAKDDAEAKMLLKELGISDPETFAQEMKAKGGMPTVEDLDSKWGMEYALASKRFIDMTIQEPNPMMRPQMANSPVGRIVYGIMSFSMSFWRNVMKRQGLLLREAAKRGALPLAVKLTAILASAVPLFIGQTIMSALRELLLNPLKWEEKEKEGTLYETLVALGFVRSFSFGMADPILQGYTGLKYQRDLSNIMIGPAPAFFLQNTQAMLMPSVRNSDETNTAEFNAARAFYNIGIGPATSIALTYVPGGPVIQGATGVGMAAATSPAAGTGFAEALVGPKDSKKKKTRKHKEGG